MRILILGGTAWLGREIVHAALADGHDVTMLARGESGGFPAGARVVVADRLQPDAYADAAAQYWDAVVDLTRHPRFAREAVAALAERTGHWLFVSSCSVYSDDATRGADESGPVHAPLDAELLEDPDDYGAAKVACERAVTAAVPDALLARVSLIGGPGDHTGRSGYWPLRFAHPADPGGRVLVPDADTPVQLIDVRDLAAWLVYCAVRRIGGAINVGGEILPLAEHLAVAQDVAGFDGETVARDADWLTARDVGPWMGPRSLPLWLPDAWSGLNAHDTSLALAHGLRRRTLAETLRDTLAWERTEGAGVERRAGLTDDDERALLAEAAEG